VKAFILIVADMVEAMEEALLPELGEPGDEAPLLQLSASSDSSPQRTEAVAPIEAAPSAHVAAVAAAAPPAAAEADVDRPWAAPMVPPARPPAARAGPVLGSSNVLSRPFARLLGTPEQREQREHSEIVANSKFVLVPGYGVLPVVSINDMMLQPQHAAAGASAQPAALHNSMLPGAARAAVAPTAGLQSGSIGPAQRLQRAIPQLRHLDSMQQFWQLWEHGDSLSGSAAISCLPLEVRSQKNVKQRFFEWKEAALEVQRLAAQMPATRAGPTAVQRVLTQLENDRNAAGLSMPAFIKSLGKKKGKAQEEGG
jgi:hypothetical protein